MVILISELLNKDAVISRLTNAGKAEYIDKILALDSTKNHVYSPKLTKFFWNQDHRMMMNFYQY